GKRPQVARESIVEPVRPLEIRARSTIRGGGVLDPSEKIDGRLALHMLELRGDVACPAVGEVRERDRDIIDHEVIGRNLDVARAGTSRRAAALRRPRVGYVPTDSAQRDRLDSAARDLHV